MLDLFLLSFFGGTMRNLIFILFTGFMITACTEGEDSGPATISSFSIIGSDVAGANGIPISTLVNNGDFSISWSSSGNDRAELYISEDNVLDNNDVMFFGVNCGDPATTLNSGCTSSANYACNYSSADVMSCDDKSGSDLTGFLDGPVTTHIILKVYPILDQNQSATQAIQVDLSNPQ